MPTFEELHALNVAALEAAKAAKQTKATQAAIAADIAHYATLAGLNKQAGIAAGRRTTVQRRDNVQTREDSETETVVPEDRQEEDTSDTPSGTDHDDDNA